MTPFPKPFNTPKTIQHAKVNIHPEKLLAYATWVAVGVTTIPTAYISCACADPVDGFTRPFKTVEVATSETGTLIRLAVQEGDVVEAGQVLAVLNNNSEAASLATAKKQMELTGRLSSARAELKLRKDRHQKLIELASRGSARQEEVIRAATDVEIANGELLQIEEQLQLRRLEYESAEIELNRRTIRSPMNGVVTKLHKEVGEFAGPNDPQLMTIVQLDPLLALFPAPCEDARRIRVGDMVSVQIRNMNNSILGIVEFIDPVVDGKSGTMRIKVRLENPRGQLFSGEPCSLLLPTDSNRKQPIRQQSASSLSSIQPSP